MGTMKAPLACYLLAGCVCLVVAACGGSELDSAAVIRDTVAAGPYSVGVTTIELVDDSRPTEANHEYPGSDTRTLPVEVWYPADATGADPVRDAPLDTADAPYPLIVFSHGLSSNRLLSVSYTQHLASHGYVVAAPDYPLSNTSAPGGPRLIAVLEQPKDLSFVLDSLLAFNEEPAHALQGAIDGDRIGATGHSLGAMTSYMSVYGPDRDDRIDAVLPISIPGCFFADDFAADASVPILLLAGTNDLITPPVSSGQAFEIANPPRYLVEVHGADHTRFADVDLTDEFVVGGGVLANLGQGDFISDAIAAGDALGGGTDGCSLGANETSDPPIEGERQRELLRQTAVLFFDGYLMDDDDALEVLRDHLSEEVPQLSVRFESGE
jgi:predicted dienelactone hydrolase